jgi:hypothetical protein
VSVAAPPARLPGTVATAKRAQNPDLTSAALVPTLKTLKTLGFESFEGAAPWPFLGSAAAIGFHLSPLG